MSLSSELRLGIFLELDIHGDFLVKADHPSAKRFMCSRKKKRGQMMQPKIAFLRNYLFRFFIVRIFS